MCIKSEVILVLHDLEHISFFEVLGDNFTKELLNFLAYDWFELGLWAFGPLGLLNGYKVGFKEHNFLKDFVL